MYIGLLTADDKLKRISSGSQSAKPMPQGTQSCSLYVDYMG